MGGCSSSEPGANTSSAPTIRASDKRAGDASWIHESRPGEPKYKGKKWGDLRSDAEKERDAHNAPAGYHHEIHQSAKHATMQQQLNNCLLYTSPSPRDS